MRAILGPAGPLATYSLPLESYQVFTGGGSSGSGSGGATGWGAAAASPERGGGGGFSTNPRASSSSSSSFADPLLGAFFGDVVGGIGGLGASLAGPLHPTAATALLLALAQACARILEEAWCSGREGSVNEYGALLMQTQLREVREALITLAPRGEPEGGEGGAPSPSAAAGDPRAAAGAVGHRPGASAIRATFAPLSQSVSLLLRVDRVAALYSLDFPERHLTRKQVEGLLVQRGLCSAANAATEVAWGRVTCIRDAV